MTKIKKGKWQKQIDNFNYNGIPTLGEKLNNGKMASMLFRSPPHCPCLEDSENKNWEKLWITKEKLKLLFANVSAKQTQNLN